MSTAQSSTLNNRVLSSRLATAFGQAPATLSIGGASLAAGDGMRVEIPVLLPQEKDETAWIKFTKNWGNTAGDSNYTGSAITVGYDWKHGEQQRNGRGVLQECGIRWRHSIYHPAYGKRGPAGGHPRPY